MSFDIIIDIYRYESSTTKKSAISVGQSRTNPLEKTKSVPNLKLIVESHISIAVKVLEGDPKAATAVRGKLVKLFKAEPAFP